MFSSRDATSSSVLSANSFPVIFAYPGIILAGEEHALLRTDAESGFCFYSFHCLEGSGRIENLFLQNRSSTEKNGVYL